MKAPKWASALLRMLAPPDRREELLGDLEETHARRVRKRGRLIAAALTLAETVDIGVAALRERRRRRRPGSEPAGSALESGRGWRLGVSLLDFKLGFRMLVKYPGLTLVGGLAMAFAIWVGAGGFELVSQVLFPRLPLPEGDRIVGVQLWDAERARVERRIVHDFAVWRDALRTIEDVSAFRTVQRNLLVAGMGVEPIEAVEISASAFRVTRVRPFLGRTLEPADEAADAAAVAVIGYDVWQKRFRGNPNVLGMTVRFGRTPVTVVGVMPEGFGFPIAHRFWVPLRLAGQQHEPRQGSGIRVFGRLADGASMAEAQAELAGLGARMAADYPETHAQLRPQLLPYAKSIISIPRLPGALIMSTNLLLLMLLVLICGNVALLMFARAAARESEIVVRNALGASRRRIITQLFAEALVLGAIAAAVGLAAAGIGLEWTVSVFTPHVAGGLLGGAHLPFWFHASLSLQTVLYAVLLTLLGAAIMGVVPALKVTRGLQARLRAAAAGGGGPSFGGVWTVVIVAQVAVTVAFPFAAHMTRRDAEQLRAVDGGFPAAEYLTARIEMDREIADGAVVDSAQFATRYRAAVQELQRRLSAEPGVVAVTYGDRLPLMYHPHRLIELDAGGAAPRDPRWPWPGYRVSSARIDPQLFAVFDASILAGRGLHASDVESGQHAIVVNQAFVERVLGGHNPIGRRVRHLRFEEASERILDEAERGPWYEIVGVVEDLGNATDWDTKVAGFYHAATPESAYPVQLALRVRGDAQAATPRLRALAAAVDPSLRLYDATPMAALRAADLKLLGFWFRMMLLVSAIALVLSLAGIYAVMSFTVARRTREIGIRVALGADARRIVLGIFKRPLTQVSLGIAGGTSIVALLLFGMTGGTLSPVQVAAIAAYGAFMLAVCMLACIVPTRRALAIEPTEALRQD